MIEKRVKAKHWQPRCHIHTEHSFIVFEGHQEGTRIQALGKNKQASIKRQTNLLNIVLILPKLFIVIFKNIDIITCFKRFKHSLSRFWLAESILRRPTYARSTSTKHYFIKLRVLLNKVGDKKLKDKLLHIILCLYLLCSRRKVAVMKETILLWTLLSIRRQF